VIISPAIAQLTNEQNRPFGFSLIFSSGIAVGVLGSQAASHLPGWLAHMTPLVTSVRAKQMALLIGCGITALAAWPAFRLKFAPAPVREKMSFPRNPFLFRFLAAIAVWSLVTGSFSPFYNAYFAQYFRMPLQRIGVVTSASQVSQALAVLAAPLIFRKFGVVTGVVYMQIATALALGCLAGVPGASAAAVVYAGYTAVLWMSQPGIYSLLMSQVSPSEQAGASALNFLVISLTQAVAATVAGAAFVRFGYPGVLAVTAGVGLAAAFLFRSLLGKNPVPASEHAHAGFGLG
jgi:predicted MFS family arabinose efflux permease